MAFEKVEYLSGDVLTAEQMNKIQDGIVTNEGNIEGHIENKNNPHGVTAEQVGAAPAGFGYGEKMPNIAAKSGESYETFCARIDELLASMPNQVTKQIYAYPPEIYGYGQCAATLFKADGNYAELRCVGNYDNIFEGWRMAKAAGVWKPFEWVNPRMALGVEYRTTERYLGKPVYAKAVDCESLLNTGVKNVSTGIAHGTLSELVECAVTITDQAQNRKYNTPAYSNGTLLATSFLFSNGSEWYINLDSRIDMSTTTAKAILRYTKTTD